MSDKIRIDPNIHFGKPCIANTRIPVKNVLELIREGHHFHEIISDYYPAITVDDIKACLQYVMDKVIEE